MDKNLPTSGQLERDLSQGIYKLYRQSLEHSPGKITCQLFSNQLAIAIENSLTAVEKTLAEANNDNKTIKKLNAIINDSIRLKLKKIVEEILQVKVVDILFDSTLESDRTGGIVVLERTPQVRNPQSIPKNNSKKKNIME